jgi:hypothetical protein
MISKMVSPLKMLLEERNPVIYSFVVKLGKFDQQLFLPKIDFEV